MSLLRRDQPRMGPSPRKEHALSSYHSEDLTIDVHSHVTRKHVDELIFARVDMRRGFGAPSQLGDNEVERSVIIRVPAIWL